MIPLSLIDPTTRPCASMALHALAYCPRLFYLKRSRASASPTTASSPAGELHAALDADEDGEAVNMELASPALGLTGKVDCLRRRDGSLPPLRTQARPAPPPNGKSPERLALRSPAGRRLRRS